MSFACRSGVHRTDVTEYDLTVTHWDRIAALHTNALQYKLCLSCSLLELKKKNYSHKSALTNRMHFFGVIFYEFAHKKCIFETADWARVSAKKKTFYFGIKVDFECIIQSGWL